MKSNRSWRVVGSIVSLWGPCLLGGLVLRAAEPPAPAAKPVEPAAPAAKSYREFPAEESLKNNRTKVTNMLRKGQFVTEDGGKQTVDDYYKKYALPRWTLLGNRTLLTAFRRDLINELRSARIEPGKPNEVYVYLRDSLILPFMNNLTKPYPPGQELNPAFRVNGMLMIGELNEKEQGVNPGANLADLPKPLPAAVPVLLAAVENPDQLDAVKVAALVGLERHAKLGGAKDPAVGDAMLRLVAASAVPEGRTADGHAWMRSQAAEILGELRSPGPNGVVAKALARMAAESNSPLDARCAAARALGRLNYQGAGGSVSAADAARALGVLTVDACRAEGQQFSRRRLKDHLTAAWFGLTGREWEPDKSGSQDAGVMSLATAAADQAVVAGVRQALENLLKPFDDRTKLDDATLAEKVRETCAALEQAVKK